MISSIANLVCKLSHELPNDLRLRILENKEILGKSQIWFETHPCPLSPFQKLNFGGSSQKTRKSRYQTFLFLSSFTGFPYPVPNTLPRIVVQYIRGIIKIRAFKLVFLVLFIEQIEILKKKSMALTAN